MSDGWHLVVNGERRDFTADAFPATLLDLVQSLGLDPAMVVAEVNGSLVRRADVPSHPLAAGDTIELVRFVGGG